MNLHTTYNNTDVINNEKNISISVITLTVNTLNNDDKPNTNNILNILLPITLPIAISNLPFLVAITLVTNSGKLVPNATTVNPIRLSDIPNACAIVDAPLTTKLPPYIIPIAPHTIYTIVLIIDKGVLVPECQPAGAALTNCTNGLIITSDKLIQTGFVKELEDPGTKNAQCTGQVKITRRKSAGNKLDQYNYAVHLECSSYANDRNFEG